MINAETSDCQIVTSSDTIDKFIELEKEKQHYLDHDLSSCVVRPCIKIKKIMILLLLQVRVTKNYIKEKEERII